MKALVLWLALGAWSAAAETAPTAEAIYRKAKAAFDAGRLEEALTQFESAYQKQPAPELVLNIAQCQRGLGRRRAAIASLEKFISLAPQHALRPAAERTLAELRLEESRAAPLPADAPVAKNLQPGDGAQGPPAVETSSSPVWPWLVGGAGVAVVAGVVIAVVVANASAKGAAPPEIGVLRLPAP